MCVWWTRSVLLSHSAEHNSVQSQCHLRPVSWRCNSDWWWCGFDFVCYDAGSELITYEHSSVRGHHLACCHLSALSLSPQSVKRHWGIGNHSGTWWPWQTVSSDPSINIDVISGSWYEAGGAVQISILLHVARVIHPCSTTTAVFVNGPNFLLLTFSGLQEKNCFIYTIYLALQQFRTLYMGKCETWWQHKYSRCAFSNFFL